MNSNQDKKSGRWFLKDDPVSDVTEQDSFGHRAYSEILADAVLNADPPFTIGVFGEWGVGKTTISKDFLAKALQSRAPGDVAFVYFDVWKYEADSLRRQFLREVATQLSNSKQLKSYDPDKELRDLIEDVSESAQRGLHFAPERLLLAGLRFVLILLGAYALLQIFERSDLLTGQNAADDLLIAVSLALLGAVSGELGKIVVIGEREVTRKSIDAPDLFEEKFRQIMAQVKPDRIAIVIDNLDRCAPDKVVEVLSTIKTFLEPSGARKQPVFVIPCDRAAIRRHLTKRGGVTEADAEEYLRKFFNAALPINPILEEEIRTYIGEELQDLEIRSGLEEEQLRELTQVISVAFRHNPRRVKQFLNTLTAKLMLIRQREKDGNIDPPISHEIPFLAKLTVIEEEWPGFYRSINEDIRALDQLARAAVGQPVELSDKLREHNGNEELRTFLRGTRRTRSTNIRAFTRLKQARIELKLPDYQEFRNALVDGRLPVIDGVMTEAPEDALEAYREATLDTLKTETDQGYFESALNVIDAAMHTDKLLSREVAVEVVERLFSVEQIRALIPSLTPFETFRLLDLADSDASRGLIAQYFDLLEQSDLQPLVSNEELPTWQAQVARGLASIEKRLSSADVNRIHALASDQLAENIGFLRELAVVEEGPDRFLTAKAFETSVNRLTIEELRLDEGGLLELNPTLDVLLNTKHLAEQAGINLLLQKAQSFLAQMSTDPAAPGRDALMELLVGAKDKLELADAATAEAFADGLRTQYSYVAPHRHPHVISVLSTLYPMLSATLQSEITTLVAQFLTSEPMVTGAGPFIAAEARRGWDKLPPPIRDLTLTQLKQRFRATGDPSEHVAIAAIFINHADQLGSGELQNLFFEAVDAQASQAIVSALGEHKGEMMEQHQDVLRATLERTVSGLSALQPDTLERQFGIIWALTDIIDDETRRGIRDLIVSLLCRLEPQIRDVGLRLLDEAETQAVIDDAGLKHLIEQVVVWLVGQVDAVDTSIRPLIARLAKGVFSADEATQSTGVNALKALLPRDPALRDIAAEYLVEFTPKERRSEVVEELIHWAKQETETPRRHTLIRHAFSIASLDRRTKEWTMLKTYLDELTESAEEADREFANSLLNSA